MDERIDDDGNRYISCNVLCVGDYGGAGAVGEANIRALARAIEGAYEEFGAYGSRQLWLPDTLENREIVEGLERDYPLYDEETYSEVETEWADEAWENWAADSLLRILPKVTEREDIDDVRNWLEDREGGFRELFEEAREAVNEYWTTENNGATIHLGRIAPTFLTLARVEKRAEELGFDLAPNSWRSRDRQSALLVFTDFLTDRGEDELADELRNLFV